MSGSKRALVALAFVLFGALAAGVHADTLARKAALEDALLGVASFCL